MRLIMILVAVLINMPTFAQEVKWYTFEQAIELNKNEPRKIMVDVYTNWCRWCKEMDKNTFNNPIIAGYLNTNYYPVKFNAEQRESVILDTTTFKYVVQGNSGYHQLAVALLNGQMSYPSVVLLNEKIQILNVIKGFHNPKEFDGYLKYFGGNYFIDNKWETWIATYKSPFN